MRRVIGTRSLENVPTKGIFVESPETNRFLASNYQTVAEMDQSVPILASTVEDDPTRYAKLIDFRDRVMTRILARWLQPQRI